jgi:repressor LexA
MTSPRRLKPREEQILGVLSAWLAEHHYPPTMRELAEAIGISSTRTVFDYLNDLEELGYIRRQRDLSRAIEIVRDAQGRPFQARSRAEAELEHVVVPILGEVAAGYPIASERPVEGELRLDPSLVRGDRSYLMRVRGDSMIDAHICDGDLILIEPRSEARNGEIVIARIEGEITLKRFFRREGFVELVPENRSMASIVITPGMENSAVLGRLLAVIRRC